MNRFGRIIKTGDLLFADSSCIVSSGGVVLGRQSGDDYVRFRIPDTNCPALPEPNAPLDSGLADEAEPNRWSVFRVRDTSNRWLLRATESGVGNDEIRLNYTIFPDDFYLQFPVSLVGYGGTYGYGNGHGVGVEIYVDDNNYIRAGAGRFWNGNYIGMWSGKIGGSNIFYEVAFVATGSNVIAELQRAGGAVAVRFSNNGTSWSDWRTLGNLAGLVRLAVRGFMVSLYQQPANDAYADCRFHYITTLSGTPSSVTVATPVVDLQKSVKCTVQRVPSLGTLEWRASDTPFQQTDTLPAWSSPEGAYRYWQARVTWTDANQLLERVEFLSEAQPLALFRRFRDYWTLWDTSQGKSIRTDDIGVLASGVQSRTADGVEVGDEERVTTIR